MYILRRFNEVSYIMKQMVTKDMIWFEKVGIPSIRKVNSSMLI